MKDKGYILVLTVDSAVGTVSSSAHLGGLVSVSVSDDNLRDVESLGLFVNKE